MFPSETGKGTSMFSIILGTSLEQDYDGISRLLAPSP